MTSLCCVSESPIGTIYLVHLSAPEEPNLLTASTVIMTRSPNNSIILSTDALWVDHLSCYGSKRKTSPVLDDIADGSLQFRNAYNTSSQTREAIPTLLTGEHPDTATGTDYRLATERINECSLVRRRIDSKTTVQARGAYTI